MISAATIPDALTSRQAVELLADLLGTLGAAIQPAGELLPEGLAAPDAAKLLGISASKFYDLDARGLLPEAVTLGDTNCRRWRRSELIAWLAAGAPSRAKWEQNRHAAGVAR
jgi:predicted DNA-binding transcriptional regulator AlpA